MSIKINKPSDIPGNCLACSLRVNVLVKDFLNQKGAAMSDDDQVRCPKCGSTQLAAGDKGFGLGKAAVGGVLLGPVGLLGGLFGSKKTVVACLKCGNKWTPGR